MLSARQKEFHLQELAVGPQINIYLLKGTKYLGIDILKLLTEYSHNFSTNMKKYEWAIRFALNF